MHRRMRSQDEREQDSPAIDQPRPLSPAASILALQRSAGNAAVARMLAAQTGKGAPVGDDPHSIPEITGNGTDTPVDTTTPEPTDTTDTTGKPGPKLTKKTVSGPTGYDDGAFKWVVQWELDKPSMAGGWVVQKVEVERDVKDKDGKPVSGGLNTAWYPLWEAWKINASQKVTTYAETGDLEDDTYGQGPIADSKGTVTVKGTPEFYEGLALPAAFKVTNKAPTWILPATNSAPAMAGGTGAIAHDLTGTWDGTAGSSDKKTKVTVK
jgi:hypothetical protein